METLNAHTKNHLRVRLLRVAHKEVDVVFSKLRKLYPQLKDIRIAFEDCPTTTMLKSGVRIESESHYDPDKRELVLFLFNLYLLADNNAGNFRMRIRTAILTIAGDLVVDELGS